MNARMLDVATGITSLLVFIIVLIAFPFLPVPGGKGMAYVLAIAVYIAVCAVISLLAAAFMPDYTGKDISREYDA